jgi:hypothetical protein
MSTAETEYENPAMSDWNQADGFAPGEYSVFSPYSLGGEAAGWKIFNKKWNQDATSEEYQVDGSGNYEGFGDTGHFSANLQEGFVDGFGTDLSGEYDGTQVTYPYTQYLLPAAVNLRSVTCYHSSVKGVDNWVGDPERQVTHLLIVGKNPTDTKWTILHSVPGQTVYQVSASPFPDGQPIMWTPEVPTLESNFFSTGTIAGLDTNDKFFSEYRFMYTGNKGSFYYSMNEIVMSYRRPVSYSYELTDNDPSGSSPETTTDPDPSGSTDPDPSGSTDPDPSGSTDPDPSGSTDPDPSGSTDPDPSGSTDPDPSGSTDDQTTNGEGETTTPTVVTLTLSDPGSSFLENPLMDREQITVNGNYFNSTAPWSDPVNPAMQGIDDGYTLFNKRWNQDTQGSRDFEQPDANNLRENGHRSRFRSAISDTSSFAMAKATMVLSPSPQEATGTETETLAVPVRYPYVELCYPSPVVLRHLLFYFSSVRRTLGVEADDGERVTDIIVCGRGSDSSVTSETSGNTGGYGGDTGTGGAEETEEPWTILNDLPEGAHLFYSQDGMSDPVEHPKGAPIAWEAEEDGSTFVRKGSFPAQEAESAALNAAGLAYSKYRFLFAGTQGGLTKQYCSLNEIQVFTETLGLTAVPEDPAPALFPNPATFVLDSADGRSKATLDSREYFASAPASLSSSDPNGDGPDVLGLKDTAYLLFDGSKNHGDSVRHSGAINAAWIGTERQLSSRTTVTRNVNQILVLDAPYIEFKYPEPVLLRHLLFYYQGRDSGEGNLGDLEDLEGTKVTRILLCARRNEDAKGEWTMVNEATEENLVHGVDIVWGFSTDPAAGETLQMGSFPLPGSPISDEGSTGPTFHAFRILVVAVAGGSDIQRYALDEIQLYTDSLPADLEEEVKDEVKEEVQDEVKEDEEEVEEDEEVKEEEVVETLLRDDPLLQIPFFALLAEEPSPLHDVEEEDSESTSSLTSSSAGGEGEGEEEDLNRIPTIPQMRKLRDGMYQVIEDLRGETVRKAKDQGYYQDLLLLRDNLSLTVVSKLQREKRIMKNVRYAYFPPSFSMETKVSALVRFLVPVTPFDKLISQMEGEEEEERGSSSASSLSSAGGGTGKGEEEEEETLSESEIREAEEEAEAKRTFSFTVADAINARIRTRSSETEELSCFVSDSFDLDIISAYSSASTSASSSSSAYSASSATDAAATRLSYLRVAKLFFSERGTNGQIIGQDEMGTVVDRFLDTFAGIAGTPGQLLRKEILQKLNEDLDAGEEEDFEGEDAELLLRVLENPLPVPVILEEEDTRDGRRGRRTAVASRHALARQTTAVAKKVTVTTTIEKVFLEDGRIAYIKITETITTNSAGTYNSFYLCLSALLVSLLSLTLVGVLVWRKESMKKEGGNETGKWKNRWKWFFLVLPCFLGSSAINIYAAYYFSKNGKYDHYESSNIVLLIQAFLIWTVIFIVCLALFLELLGNRNFYLKLLPLLTLV